MLGLHRHKHLALFQVVELVVPDPLRRVPVQLLDDVFGNEILKFLLALKRRFYLFERRVEGCLEVQRLPVQVPELHHDFRVALRVLLEVALQVCLYFLDRRVVQKHVDITLRSPVRVRQHAHQVQFWKRLHSKEKTNHGLVGVR